MSTATEAAVLEALKTVIDPNTGRDFVSTRAIRNVRLEGDDLAFELELGYPAKSQHAALRGVKAVSYHRDLVYLADRYGIELVGTIETKPGVPATPGHIEELVETMEREQVQLVIREVAYEMPLARTVAERTGAEVVTISTLAGGLPDTKTYVESVEANLEALVRAVRARGGGDL